MPKVPPIAYVGGAVAALGAGYLWSRRRAAQAASAGPAPPANSSVAPGGPMILPVPGNTGIPEWMQGQPPGASARSLTPLNLRDRKDKEAQNGVPIYAAPDGRSPAIAFGPFSGQISAVSASVRGPDGKGWYPVDAGGHLGYLPATDTTLAGVYSPN